MNDDKMVSAAASKNQVKFLFEQQSQNGAGKTAGKNINVKRLLHGYEDKGVHAFVLEDFLSNSECDFIVDTVLEQHDLTGEDIAIARVSADEQAPKAFGSIHHIKYNEDHNVKDRYTFHSKDFSEILYERLKPFVQEFLDSIIVSKVTREGHYGELSSWVQQAIGHVDEVESKGFATENTRPTPGESPYEYAVVEANTIHEKSGDVLIKVKSTPVELQQDNLNLGNYFGNWEGTWDKRTAFLNEKFEFMKYQKGGFFRAHLDENLFHPDHKDKARSIYTVIFYLTDAFQGGETNFLENDPNTDRLLYTDDATGDFVPGTKRVFASVKPKKGSCLLFYQRGVHCIT
eukprot:gnl/MRDRNA2_/MRDRNA2_114590_c0_seq1.p1 gnl/MRDRNA2_/MRDRNA2_114590_c0~~gnl/MRDRNA2_/MRDRNA2_114590_c0_seq1.p1  ORF type:complete len:345 (+),score=65.45 gnl/MRDRNA2_/MRDRNA2_114590_c0_seq1:87-1121(+)